MIECHWLPSQVFYDTTEYFSHSMPSLPMVIPTMDIIDDWLNEDSISSTLCSPRGSPTCQEDTQQILWEDWPIKCLPDHHPKHKLRLFQNVGWVKAWINTVEELVHEEFDHYYGVDEDQIDIATADPATPSPKVSFLFPHYQLLSHALRGTKAMETIIIWVKFMIYLFSSEWKEWISHSLFTQFEVQVSYVKLVWSSLFLFTKQSVNCEIHSKSIVVFF